MPGAEWVPALGGLLAGALRLIVVLVLAVVLRRVARRAAPHLTDLALRVERRDDEPPQDEEAAKRRETLNHVVLRTTDLALAAVVGFVALSELGFDLTA
ncbi:MAG: hypothetical protein HYY05_02145, partial [Chloroflexi bacterium]|nr:hypothetical protein [Chloroflexota bacterium]